MPGQGSGGNVLAALCSFLIPGLGQLLQGRLMMAIIHFVLANQRYFPSPASGVSFWKIFLVELLFTFVLCYVVLTVATSRKLQGNYIYGIAIGFALLTIAFLGGTYNPAVSTGPILL